MSNEEGRVFGGCLGWVGWGRGDCDSDEVRIKDWVVARSNLVLRMRVVDGVVGMSEILVCLGWSCCVDIRA